MLGVDVDQIGGVLGREALHRGQQQRLPRKGRDARQPRPRDRLAALDIVGLRAVAGMGRAPDRLEGAVQAQARIDVARKLLGCGDDRLQRGANILVAFGLATGQRASVAPQKGKVRRELLSERHMRDELLWDGPVCGCRHGFANSFGDPGSCIAPEIAPRMEPTTGCLVSSPGCTTTSLRSDDA